MTEVSNTTSLSGNQQQQQQTLVDSIEQERLKSLLLNGGRSQEEYPEESSVGDQESSSSGHHHHHQKSPSAELNLDSDSIENADGTVSQADAGAQQESYSAEKQVESNVQQQQARENTHSEDILNASLKISTNSLESHHNKSPTTTTSTSSITPTSVKSYRGGAKLNTQQHTPTGSLSDTTTISKPATPTPIGLNEKMSPGLAKRVTPSMSNGEISLSTSPVTTQTGESASLTIKGGGGGVAVVGNSSKSPTPVSSAPMSSNSSSSSSAAAAASNANQKIQSALERNIQKLNTLPGKSNSNIRIANLSKEDIELFTQSVDQQQQYYQHAYSFACDSLQSTPEHHHSKSSPLHNHHHPHNQAANSAMYQQYLLNEQHHHHQDVLNEEGSNDYYMDHSSSGQGINLVGGSPSSSLIQPYYIQGDLNRGPPMKIKSLRNNILMNAEREMTPDSIDDENLVEVVRNTKKMTIASHNRRVQQNQQPPTVANSKNLLMQKQRPTAIGAPVPVKKQPALSHQTSHRGPPHPHNNRLPHSHSSNNTTTTAGSSPQQQQQPTQPLKNSSSLASAARNSNKSNSSTMPSNRSHVVQHPTNRSMQHHSASQAIASKSGLPLKPKQSPINKIQSRQHNQPPLHQQQHINDHTASKHHNTAINKNGTSKATSRSSTATAAAATAVPTTIASYENDQENYYDENDEYDDYDEEDEGQQDHHGELVDNQEEEVEYEEEEEDNCYEQQQEDLAEVEGQDDDRNVEYYQDDDEIVDESQEANYEDNMGEEGGGYDDDDEEVDAHEHSAATTFTGQQFGDEHERGGDLTKSFIQRSLKKAYNYNPSSRQKYQEMKVTQQQTSQQIPTTSRSIQQQDNSFIYSNNKVASNGAAKQEATAMPKSRSVVNPKNSQMPKFHHDSAEKKQRQPIPKSNTTSQFDQQFEQNGSGGGGGGGGGKIRLKSSSSNHNGQNNNLEPSRRRSFNQQKNVEGGGKIIDETTDEASDPAAAASQIPIEQQYDTDEETNKLLDNSLTENASSADDEHHQHHQQQQQQQSHASQSEQGQSKSKEMNLHQIMDPETQVLIEGVLFRAKYLGSTQLVSDGNPTKLTRMLQAQEAVGRIKAPEGESQPSVEVDLFVSTEKIMVLNTNLQEIMMDHSLRSISYIADIGNLVVLMAKRRAVVNSDEQIVNPLLNKRQVKMICHVFESEDAQIVAQSIGQAFQVAYMEYLKANGIEDMSIMKDLDYQEVLNQQEIMGNELLMFAKKECQKEVIVPKLKNEILGLVIVESGWGSMLPTVVVANIMPTGPAARCSNLNIGDQIISVNGISLVGLNLAACQAQIKSTKHLTLVRLVVVPCPPVVEVLIKRPDTKYQLGFSVQDGIICSLLRGGIAERGGVRVGHRIIEINNQSVVAVNHEKIVSMLANSVGELRMKTMPTQMFRLLTGQEAPVYI